MALYAPIVAFVIWAVFGVIVEPKDSLDALVRLVWIWGGCSLVVLLVVAPFKVWMEDQVKIEEKDKQIKAFNALRRDGQALRALLTASADLSGAWLALVTHQNVSGFNDLHSNLDLASAEFLDDPILGPLLRTLSAAIRKRIALEVLAVSGAEPGSNPSGADRVSATEAFGATSKALEDELRKLLAAHTRETV